MRISCTCNRPVHADIVPVPAPLHFLDRTVVASGKRYSLPLNQNRPGAGSAPRVLMGHRAQVLQGGGLDAIGLAGEGEDSMDDVVVICCGTQQVQVYRLIMDCCVEKNLSAGTGQRPTKAAPRRKGWIFPKLVPESFKPQDRRQPQQCFQKSSPTVLMTIHSTTSKQGGVVRLPL